MQKLQEHIEALQSKPEHIRKQILVGTLTACMVVVVGVWVYGLGNHFSSGDVSVQAKEDAKPLTIFSQQIKGAYKNLTATAGKTDNEEEPPKPEAPAEKIIDVIPVEQ